MKKTYHLCLSAGEEIMFRDLEDYHRGFNLLSEAEDRIAVVNDLFAMGDENHCVIREAAGETFHQCGFSFRIKGRTELVEKKDAAWTEKGARYGYTLSLTFRETCTRFETLGV